MKLKKYNQMFEKDIKEVLPEDYLEDIKKNRAKEYQGGPSREDIMKSMDLMRKISQIQDGHEEELTKIGKKIIMHHYGNILDDVELDIKIVKPHDEEKMEMTKKMFDDEPDEEKEINKKEEIGDDLEVDEDEVSKRKLSNVIMQGESQNVHSMMYSYKDEIDEIDSKLLDLYKEHLELNRKFDWDENRPEMEEMMKEHPEMSNTMETEYPEGDDEEDGNIKIKVRALDLPLLVHETVKGIYELITNKAIPEDPKMAELIMSKTDTLTDEEQDIKYGPYIAADIRDFLNNYLKNYGKESLNVNNIREFIFSEIIMLDADIFVELIKSIILNEEGKVKKIFNDYNIIENSIENATFDETTVDYQEYPEDIEDDDETPEHIKNMIGDQKTIKEKDYSEMSKSELNDILNKALDEGDFETIRKIKDYLD